MAVLLAACQGAKDIKTGYINRWELIKQQLELREIIPIDGAKLYLKLKQEHKVPMWVEKITDDFAMELVSG